MLRRWLRADEGARRVAIGTGVDRKTAQRYIEAAEALGAPRQAGQWRASGMWPCHWSSSKKGSRPHRGGGPRFH